MCQRVEPAQTAWQCADCPGCVCVAGELESLRAAEIFMLSAAACRAVARQARQKSLCDLCRHSHVAGHAERPATDALQALAVLRTHA